ncbi:MAG: NADH-quinone oxidoreductase subunit NuoG [Nitrospirota bacterium]|nr:NADH-quinone oxidoreductase subunit NuoG [Nitrospirota bacterium]
MSEAENQNLVTVSIDGQSTKVPQGTLVIEAARQVGVMIPHFCYHPKLTPDANCRMCLVEIEKIPRLQTSCSTRVTEGMVVRSSVPTVATARKSVLEFILANHPLDCPVCDQGGRCDLQDFSHEYTPTTSRFQELKRVFPKEYFSPLIETQMNRCVQCLRCVRYCDQVMDVKALAPAGRGTMTEIKHFGHHELDCEFCGGCIQICPVGAITSRLSLYDFRPWMLKRTETICGYCGDGCQITVQTKNDQPIEVNSTHGAGRNNGDLCARGYFGYHASVHEDRLQHPMIRQADGTFAEVTWEEALEFVANGLQQTKSQHGPDAIGGLITARCTNEELYLFQRFMRGVIGTNNIDSSARYGYMNGFRAMQRVQGTLRWTITYEDIVAADTILLVGTNITETNPITGLKVKEAVKQHEARLITLETLLPVRGTISNITTLATHHITVHPNQYDWAIQGLIKSVVEQNFLATGLVSKASGFVEAIRKAVSALPWSKLEECCGWDQSVFDDAARTLHAANRCVALVGPGVLRARSGEQMVTNVLDLLILLGHHGQSGSGLGLLAEENNEQGAVEMGVVTEYLPGPSNLDDSTVRKNLATIWGQELPSGSGSTMVEMLDQARAGQIKAMFVVGENPMASLPRTAQVGNALDTLDLLICQELFLTETAKRAHVVLPACSSFEKDGTFTNTEGHVQSVRKVHEPVGDSQPDWEIFSTIALLMNHPIEYDQAKDIFKEIRSVIPGYGLLGPTSSPPAVKSSVVDQYVQQGFQDDLAQRYAPGAVTPEAEGVMTLMLGQSLFHSGKFSTRAKGLIQIQSKGLLHLNAEDAERLSVKDGDSVLMSNEQGSATTQVKLVDRVPLGVAWFPEHFDQDILHLFTHEVEAASHVPTWKLTQVKILPEAKA